MTETGSQVSSDARHAIIAGFGVPGRLVAESLRRRGMSYCVIEMNPITVDRCEHSGVPIIAGDAREEQTLRRAGIERATLIAITLPDEGIALAAIAEARRLNPHARIIARLSYTSAGLEAARRGASDVIVAEQTVAREFSRLIEGALDE
jgi:voltage-gated potassium channel Kch